MKTFFSSVLVLFILLFLIACSNKKVEQQLVKIDSLSQVIDSVDVKLKQINRDTIVNRYHTYQVTLDTISKHFKEVRNDVSFKYICAYQEVRKPFKTMSLNYNMFRAEIDSSRKQLKNLTHDVKEKLLSDTEFETFFKNECNSINAIYFKVSKSIEQVNDQMKNYDTVHPYLIKLIKDHKSGKKTTK